MLRKIKGLRSRLFKIFLLIIILVILAVTVAIYSLSSNVITRTIMINQTNKVFNQLDGVVKDVGQDVGEELKVENKYPGTDILGEEIKYDDGTRGNGVNLLLLNNIKTEGYVKELLTLYADYSQGKITNDKYTYHLGIEALLGLQANETGTYSGTGVVKSYLPYDANSKKIYWNEAYKGVPAAGLTMKTLNENIINGAPKAGGAPYSVSGKLPYTINGINPVTDKGNVANDGPPRDINAYQVNRENFSNTGNGGVLPAKIAGYNASTSRKTSDAYYLPDNLSYIDGELATIRSDYFLSTVEDPLLMSAVYSMYHNAGPYSWSLDASFGVYYKYDSKLRKPKTDAEKAAYVKAVTGLPQDLIDGTKDMKQITENYNDIAVGALVLLKQGYYLNDKAYYTLSKGSFLEKRTTPAWELVFGEKLAPAEVKKRLKAYNKSLTEVYPGYATSAQIKATYGFSADLSEKGSSKDWDDNNGAVFKLTDETSPLFNNKINGKEPRIMRTTSIITAGHVVGTTNKGKFVYAAMLKYAGVTADVTNPDTYMEKIENEFKPAVSDFSAIMTKIGANVSNKHVYNMLKTGYDKSGFWYFLGGHAKPVSQKSYADHLGMANYKPQDYTPGIMGKTKKQYFNNLYKTKDGSTPTSKTKDSNLVNYGKYLFDCSSFTAYAYNTAVQPALGGATLPPNANDQRTHALLRNVKKSAVKTGDILVSPTHVFFYLSTHKGSAASLGMNNTNIETDQTANAGSIWVLEAPDSNKKVGIRVRPQAALDKYTIRSFRKLE